MAVLQLMISPVGKLPIELLAHIFHLVVPPEAISEEDEDNTDWIIEGALTVSQVCRHWRRIAHGTPCLWVDGFRLSATQDPDLALDDLEQTTAWLERSHPLPITIYFPPDAANVYGVLSGTGVFGALLSTARRWRTIVWDMPSLLPLCDPHQDLLSGWNDSPLKPEISRSRRGKLFCPPLFSAESESPSPKRTADKETCSPSFAFPGRNLPIFSLGTALP
ncbi:hypothetical protein DFH06DRAFT_1160752 [Mycena polygramma]|nr:hypothetical protein DFH06DRAFT_1160752 [Mycena polygramma]